MNHTLLYCKEYLLKYCEVVPMEYSERLLLNPFAILHSSHHIHALSVLSSPNVVSGHVLKSGQSVVKMNEQHFNLNQSIAIASMNCNDPTQNEMKI